ncbi:hypothetical protein GCM10009193_00760 [Shewanella aestuarii]|uniref:YqcC family protein n=2 Tax=Shewanella aestuarii TaxID=1028752 RepID=A0ABT0KW65_9GAMM|nr:YqcC family protein [Shewanella aestuarii]MCL1115650.1 YqcC family protein [Shewanella aestuarii]GGN68097.1 hypothetical protein GCM10009193_00760 [Shewanella aestuarii]
MIYEVSLTFLVALEQQLKAGKLWSTTQPSASAMASTAPFACDTLSFEQWLQFVFIPKMQQLIITKSPLPTNMAVAPMAEQIWQNEADKQIIIKQLVKFDQLIANQNRAVRNHERY